MKLNLKTIYCGIAVTYLYMILTALSGVLKINHVPLNNSVSLLSNFIIECGYIMIIWCLLSVLKYIGEKSSIVTGFGIYILIDGLIFLLRTLFLGFSILKGGMVLNIITFLTTFYFILQTFRVRHIYFSVLFKVLGSATLCLFVFKAIAFILLIMHSTGRSMLTYMVIANLITPTVILLIFHKALRSLKMASA